MPPVGRQFFLVLSNEEVIFFTSHVNSQFCIRPPTFCILPPKSLTHRLGLQFCMLLPNLAVSLYSHIIFFAGLLRMQICIVPPNVDNIIISMCFIYFIGQSLKNIQSR